MKNIVSFMGKTPRIEEDVYIDPSSRIIGDVLLKKGCSIWPLCVLRAVRQAHGHELVEWSGRFKLWRSILTERAQGIHILILI